MFEAHIASDLFEAGKTEEGFPIVGELYYVIVENDKGRRFRHFHNFKGINVEFVEDGLVAISDLRDAAVSHALDLMHRVNAALAKGMKLDDELWAEIDPVYGSSAYVSQGTEYKRWAEENMEVENV